MGQFFFSLAPAYITTAEVACVKVVEVVAAPLFVFLFVNEQPGLHTVLGGAVIVVGIVSHSIATLRADKSERMAGAVVGGDRRVQALAKGQGVLPAKTTQGAVPPSSVCQHVVVKVLAEGGRGNAGQEDGKGKAEPDEDEVNHGEEEGSALGNTVVDDAVVDVGGKTSSPTSTTASSRMGPRSTST